MGTQLISDWRQLPSIVTPTHMKLVRMAQRVQEVTEANQINKVVVEKMVRYPPGTHLPMPIVTPSKQFPALPTHRYFSKKTQNILISYLVTQLIMN